MYPCHEGNEGLPRSAQCLLQLACAVIVLTLLFRALLGHDSDVPRNHSFQQLNRTVLNILIKLAILLFRRPTSDNLGTLENEVAALKNEVVKLEKEKEMSAQVESGKWMQNVEEMKDEISK